MKLLQLANVDVQHIDVICNRQLVLRLFEKLQSLSLCYNFVLLFFALSCKSYLVPFR